VPKAFIQVVKYNQAAALQKTDDEDLADKAIGMLTAILNSDALDPLLLRLAKSGKLAAIADRYARHRRREVRWGRELPVEWMGEVEIFLAEGEALLAEIESSVAGGGQDGAENNVVLAVIRNAVGQLEAILDRSEDARGHYRGALTLLPSFLEASLNLADLYFEKQAALDINWPTRAERLLLDVQSADPRNTRCLVLLGSLYGTTLFGRFDKAQDLLTQALPDPSAGQRLGALLFGQAKPAEAVAPLLSAVEQDRLGFSHLLLTHCTLALPVVDPRRHPLLLREKAWLLEMLDGKAGDVYRKDAENLLPAVEAALTTPPEKAADPG
jgi:tetratricopeptide (TPR) repeat protein